MDLPSINQKNQNELTTGFGNENGFRQSTPLNLRKKRRLNESLIQGFLFACGALSIFTTIGIVYELTKEACFSLEVKK